MLSVELFIVVSCIYQVQRCLQYVVRAPADGTVASVLHAVGDTVSRGSELVVFETEQNADRISNEQVNLSSIDDGSIAPPHVRTTRKSAIGMPSCFCLISQWAAGAASRVVLSIFHPSRSSFSSLVRNLEKARDCVSFVPFLN